MTGPALPPLDDLPRQPPPPTDEDLATSYGWVLPPAGLGVLWLIAVELLLVLALQLVLVLR